MYVQVTEKFDSLDARVFNLESVISSKRTSPQVWLLVAVIVV